MFDILLNVVKIALSIATIVIILKIWKNKK